MLPVREHVAHDHVDHVLGADVDFSLQKRQRLKSEAQAADSTPVRWVSGIQRCGSDRAGLVVVSWFGEPRRAVSPLPLDLAEPATQASYLRGPCKRISTMTLVPSRDSSVRNVGE